MADEKHGFLDWAGTHRDIETRADEALADVVKAATKHGKEATLTIKLKVKPNNENQLTHTVDISTKLPRQSVPPAIFFGDDSGGLHRADPRQHDLEEEIDRLREKTISEQARADGPPAKPN